MIVKYLFLDIDGVMVSHRDRSKHKRGLEWNDYWIPERTMLLLKKICEHCDPRIVITSQWGRIPDAMRYLYSRFDEYGLEIYSAFQGREEKESILNSRFKTFESYESDGMCVKYAVLDDDEMDVRNLVKVDAYYGLTEAVAEEVIKLLN